MLQKIGFQPGINKQVTATAAEGQWIDCDNVRFRYSTPEKIGGWTQLGADNITGAQYDAFEQVMFAPSGISFSINNDGNLIATI